MEMSVADQLGGHNPVRLMAFPQSSKGISMGGISSGGSSVARAAKPGHFFLGGGGAWWSLGRLCLHLDRACVSASYWPARGRVSPVPTEPRDVQTGGSGRRILESVPTCTSVVVYASMRSTPAFPYCAGMHVVGFQDPPMCMAVQCVSLYQSRRFVETASGFYQESVHFFLGPRVSQGTVALHLYRQGRQFGAPRQLHCGVFEGLR